MLWNQNCSKLRSHLKSTRPGFKQRWLLRIQSRRGGIVIMAVLVIAITTMPITAAFLEEVLHHYSAVHAQSSGYKAQCVAMAGFQAGLTALKMIPEDKLYNRQMIGQTISVPMDRDCKEGQKKCLVTYVGFKLQPEDGKLNLNNLVLAQDETNEAFRKTMVRFFQQFDDTIIKEEQQLSDMEREEGVTGVDAEQRVNAIIDWLDENNNEYGDGAESAFYDGLNGERQIKNGMFYNLSELTQVRGFNRRLLYDPLVDEEWLEARENRASMTDEEIDLIQDADWIMGNNLAAYIPFSSSTSDKININAARYHAIMALSEMMNERAVKALFELRRKNGHYIKNLSDIQKLPEFNIRNSEDITLYQELVGGGGDINGLIKIEGEYYRIVGVGSVVREADNNPGKSKILAVRRVWGIYEKSSRRLIYYSED